MRAAPFFPPLLGLLLVVAAAPLGVDAQDVRTTRFTRGWQGEAALDVQVKMGAGILAIHGASRDVLYDVQLRTADQSGPTLLHQYTPGRLTVGTDWESADERGRRRVIDMRGLRASDVQLDLALNRRAPMDLKVDVGASTTTLDLGDLPLRTLELNLGAGTVSLQSQAPNPVPMRSMAVNVGAGTFDARGLGFLGPERIEVAVGLGQATLGWEGLYRPRTRLNLSIALGQVELFIPEAVGVSVNRSGFLFRTSGAELRRAGDRWVTENWESATVRLEIVAEGALGGLEIVRIPNR